MFAVLILHTPALRAGAGVVASALLAYSEVNSSTLLGARWWRCQAQAPGWDSGQGGPAVPPACSQSEPGTSSHQPRGGGVGGHGCELASPALLSLLMRRRVPHTAGRFLTCKASGLGSSTTFGEKLARSPGIAAVPRPLPPQPPHPVKLLKKSRVDRTPGLGANPERTQVASLHPWRLLLYAADGARRSPVERNRRQASSSRFNNSAAPSSPGHSRIVAGIDRPAGSKTCFAVGLNRPPV